MHFFEAHGFVLEILTAVGTLTWWLERRRCFALRCAAAIMLLAASSAFWMVLPVDVLTQTGRTLSFWTVSALGVWFCFRLPATWSVFYATAAATMQHIAFRGAKLIQALLYEILGAEWVWQWLYVPLFVALCVVCYFFCARRLQYRVQGELTGRTVLTLLVGMQLCINLFANLFNAYATPSGPKLFTIYGLFDLVSCLFLFMLLCEIVDKNDAERDNAVLRQMMRQQRQQLEMSKDTVELINIKCHDIKKQLSGLGGRVSQEELDELNRAVSIYDTAAKTGDAALDVLLAERSLLCKGRGIQFDYMVDGEKLAFLKPGEVYSLFGNALDNAIEAVSGIKDEERRYIGLQVREKCGMLLIRVENCIDAAPELDGASGLPRTTKGDPREHGFGMKSMRRLAEKYGGSLTVHAGDGVFTLTAVLPLPQTAPA